MNRKILLLLLCVLLFAKQTTYAQYADSVLSFISTHKESTSLCMIRNDSVLVKWNDKTMLPLGGAIKLMVGIEFAKQVAAGMIPENAYLPLSNILRYYVEGSDNDAYDTWFAYAQAKKQIKEDSIQLMNVARGMMQFDCPALLEYLMDVLEMENLNSNIRLFDIKNHSIISYPVSSMFLFQNPSKKRESDIIKQINKYSDEDYCKLVSTIHDKLSNDDNAKGWFRVKEFTSGLQKVWTNRLTASTTREYAYIANKLNNRKEFDGATYGYVAEIIEMLMENPENVSLYKHAAVVGGGTPSLLSRIVYGKMMDNSRVEVAYILNNLTEEEAGKLEKWYRDFEKQILQNAGFRNKLITTLQP